MATSKLWRNTLNIVVRLSIVGFPLADNMRCKLLLGFDVSIANFSKPTVAFTKSLKTSRAISGSPFRKSYAASFSRATANS